MIIVETLKLIAAALTVIAAVLGILGKPTNDAGTLTPRGRRLIILAGLSFVCAVGLQVAQYLNVLESSRTLERRHKEIIESVGYLREGAEKIRGETNRLSIEATRISWGLTIDPVPVREMHVQCDFHGPIEESRLNERGALQIRLDLFRSNQGELGLSLAPKLTGAANSPIGTLFVGRPTFRAQNVPLRESALSPRLRKENGEPFLLWVALPIAEVRAGAQRMPGDADWPLPTIAYLRRTRLVARVDGTLVDRIRSVSLMINRDLLLHIPLHQSNGRLEGTVDDGFVGLQPRPRDRGDETKK